MKKFKSKKGFTLVELLVVIAIIGILAVVAVPALFKNIEKGKVADLEADISAIRSAVLSYYSDNSDYPAEENNKIVTLSKDISKESNPEAIKLLAELEGLSFPYGGTYELTNKEGNEPATSPGTLYLKITTGSKDSTISQSGLDKLAQDLGLSKDGESPDLVVTPAIDSNAQVIKLPLINK